MTCYVRNCIIELSTPLKNLLQSLSEDGYVNNENLKFLGINNKTKAMKYGQQKKRKTIRLGKNFVVFCASVGAETRNTNFKLSNKLLPVFNELFLFSLTTTKAAKNMKLVSYVVPAKRKPLLTNSPSFLTLPYLQTCSLFFIFLLS